MFLGTHQPRLDEKGRLFLPAKYREELAGGVVITKGQEQSAFLVQPRLVSAEKHGPTSRRHPPPLRSTVPHIPPPSTPKRPETELHGSRMAR